MREAEQSKTRVDLLILAFIAAVKLAIHFTLNGRYGYMRDELYFVDCGRHLAFGYVDIGPLAPWLGRLSRELVGDTLFGLRFFPALAGAATVFLTGLMVRRLGGGRFAQVLAALAVAVAPVYLLTGNIFSLPSFEPFFWVLCSLILLTIIQTGNSRLWLWFGLVAGLGLLNKPSMLFYGAAVTAGLALTPQRKFFKDPYFYAAGAIAFAVAAPFVVWNATHGWPTIEFMTKLNRDIMSRIPVREFLAGQVLYIHPLNFPVWLVGLAFYLRSNDARQYRVFGWAYVILLVFLAVAKSKIYYLSPAYPMLLAGGAFAIERFVRNKGVEWLKRAVVAALAVGGAVTAPGILPILPIEWVDTYSVVFTWGMVDHAYEATQTLHDMLGWEEQVKAVAEVYHSLPPEDQEKCVILGPNFGRSGALSHFGGKYGLPQTYGIHQNYWYWGPPEKPGEILLCVGGDVEDIGMFYEDIVVANVILCAQCARGEQEVPVYVCRKPRMTIQELWTVIRPFAFEN